MNRLLFATALLALTACTTVDPGNVGIYTSWGAVEDGTYAEGFHWVDPFGGEMIEMDGRVQKLQATATASSSDLQVVSTTIALNYKIDATEADVIFQEYGELYNLEDVIIKPALQEAVKTATARYTAEELITQRPMVKADMTEYITDVLAEAHIVVTDLSIVDFQFDVDYQDAIEAKQIAEQQAQQATNDLERIRIEAEQEVARAEGAAAAMLALAEAEATAQELQAQTITPEIIRLRAIERWDGTLPKFVGQGDGIPEIILSQ